MGIDYTLANHYLLSVRSRKISESFAAANPRAAAPTVRTSPGAVTLAAFLDGVSGGERSPCV